MKLVPDWREAWKWFSVWVCALAGASPVAWNMIPEDVRATFPENWMMWAGLAYFVIFLMARLIDQGKPEDETSDPWDVA